MSGTCSVNGTARENNPEHTGGPYSLQVEELFKRYGKKVAVRNVGFSMKSGEVVGLLGPNGAGKTTIFYMIVGFIHGRGGSIHLDGADITRKPMYRRARLGISYLPQEPSVFRKLTVEHNVLAVLNTRSELTKKERREKLEELLEEFHITDIRKRIAHSLSGGERRRTEIARSLAAEPKFLLLDEPFAGIDPIAVADIKELVTSLSRRGVGILVTDHNVQHTLAITNRSYIIHLGEIMARGSKEEILSNPKAREIYLGSDFSM
ncbi:MAG: LPS export ABC transporter ATP-binding protein [Spirochaetia bacterium]